MQVSKVPLLWKSWAWNRAWNISEKVCHFFQFGLIDFEHWRDQTLLLKLRTDCGFVISRPNGLIFWGILMPTSKQINSCFIPKLILLSILCHKFSVKHGLQKVLVHKVNTRCLTCCRDCTVFKCHLHDASWRLLKDITLTKHSWSSLSYRIFERGPELEMFSKIFVNFFNLVW